MSCSEKSITAWFKEYQELVNTLGITSPAKINNCDESGFPLQVKNGLKVCANQHARRNFKRVSANKDSITTVQCICANGSVLPSSVLFSGKSMDPEYSYQLPCDGFVGFSPSSWMTTEQFFGWIANHFIKKHPTHSHYDFIYRRSLFIHRLP